ncbi:MAG TPA: kelch repeat-containing protein [Verrucomicrobiae bacterium]
MNGSRSLTCSRNNCGGARGQRLGWALGALVLSVLACQATTAGSFTLVRPLRQFRRLHTATLLANGTVLIAGGRPFAEAATSELYDPVTQTWTNAGRRGFGLFPKEWLPSQATRLNR